MAPVVVINSDSRKSRMYARDVTSSRERSLLKFTISDPYYFQISKQLRKFGVKYQLEPKGEPTSTI